MAIEQELQNCKKKTRYPNEELAQRTANKAMRGDLNAPALFVYECEWCKGWHLTKNRV